MANRMARRFTSLMVAHLSRHRRCLAWCAIALAACTPKYDWRETRGTDAPFAVLFPAKPATHSRAVNLGGIEANMTMMAAEIGDTTFAVGTAELPDAAQARAALEVMKKTMVGNIGGVIRHEKPVAGMAAPAVELDAGPAAGAAGTRDPRALFARFVARDRRVYQVVVVGKEKTISPEAVETFLTSFKLE